MIKNRNLSLRELIPLVIAILSAASVILILILCPRTENKPEVPSQPDIPSYDLSDADYSAGIGFEGLRVKRVKDYLGLGETTGMGGAYYGEDVEETVRIFQAKQNLPATGKVDFETWEKMGLSREEWELCGNYRSPSRVNPDDDREIKIEAMIERAMEYVGDPYVIGASGPPGRDYGLDCSGLVIQALYAAGVSMDDINEITHAHPGHEYESRNLWHSSHFTKVPYEERERGDLVFYDNGNGVVIHVAIYLGDDQVIESMPNAVQISPVINRQHQSVIGLKRVF